MFLHIPQPIHFDESLSIAKLLSLIDNHKVSIIWVKGHAGHPENERCDKLAVAAATRAKLQNI